MTRRSLFGFAFVLASLACLSPVFASMFGEENTTLVSILTELVDSGSTLSDISQTADEAARTLNDLSSTYRKVYAGVESVEHFSFDGFLSDLENDFTRRVPGLGRLEYATANFDAWTNTHSTSPETAYRAISSLTGTVTAPLRTELQANHANIDRALALGGEAATGLATAEAADAASEKLDAQIAALAQEAKNPSPGRAGQLTAQASFLLLAQQSQMLRLLSRSVRTGSTEAALAFGTRIEAHTALTDQSSALSALQADALSSAKLISFGETP